MKTVEEAKERRCPYARKYKGLSIEKQIQANESGMGNCSADKCMMWRWGKECKWPDAPEGQGATLFHGDEKTIINSTKGYCGLAGYPNGEVK